MPINWRHVLKKPYLYCKNHVIIDMKRSFDIIFALCGIVLFFPLMVFIAIFIKIESEGPVIYKGVRTGRGGKPFNVFKFRTMVEDAEKKGGPSTALNDHRLTRIGRFLRKYKLDELPQLMNILRGEMSFVGPRPQVERYTKLYNEEEKIILTVRPGLTDYASVKFINLDRILGDGPVDEIYIKQIEPQKNVLRLEYVKNSSLWVDLKIIYQTFMKLLRIGSLWNI